MCQSQPHPCWSQRTDHVDAFRFNTGVRDTKTEPVAAQLAILSSPYLLFITYYLLFNPAFCDFNWLNVIYSQLLKLLSLLVWLNVLNCTATFLSITFLIWKTDILYHTENLCQTALTISPCVHDDDNVSVAEVERGKTNRFYCRGFQTMDTVQWNYIPDNGQDLSAGSCGPLNSNPQCSPGSLAPTFTASRTSNTESVMTVDPTTTSGSSAVMVGTFGCRTSRDVATVACQMDLISG